MSEGVELQLDGKAHTTWSSLAVGWSMEHAASSFEVGVEHPLDETLQTPEPANQKHARLLLDGEPVVDGYVFRDSRGFDAEEFRLSLAGASRAFDLVDSDPVDQSETFRKQGLRAITEKLVDGFGDFGKSIDVRFEDSEGDKFAKFAVEEGDTVFSTIERAARQRGLLVMSAADGALMFTRVATSFPQESLTVGVNVVSGTAERDDREVFSDYYFYGQTSANDHHHGRSACHLKGQVVDPRMRRYRPKVGLEGQSLRESPEQRAVWESNTRYGRSQRFVYEVEGWKTSGGNLWAPNTLVFVQDPLNHVIGVQLIASVRFSLNSQDGKMTELTVCPPEAFTLEAP